ncbi:MAG TPA: ABC transporter ATP-binding protein [Acidimicrobiia bacterium]|nr:ABC transporter ATP-binding protein [Acidimicrobiia bacterium]
MSETMTTRAALRRLFGEVPGLVRGLVITAALAVVGTGLQIAIPVIVQLIIDVDILGGDSVDVASAARRGAIAAVAMAVAAVARRSATFRLARLSASALAELRIKVFAHLHRLSALHVQAERRGALVARVTSDIYRIQDFMEWGGMGMLIGVSQVLLAVAAMLFYRWQLALLVVIGVTVYGAALLVFQRVLGRAHDRVRERVADSMSALGESITGLPTVRAYGAEDPTLHRVRSAVDAQFRAEFRTYSLGSALFSSAEVFAGGLTAAVVGFGILLGPESGLTAGGLIAFLFLVNLLVQPVQTLVETLDSAQAAGAGMRKVIGVLDTPVDLADPPNGVDLPDRALDVSVRGLSFRYPTGEMVLQDVDVDIAPGRRVAVVGQTGSGKTTFAKLVVRLLDPAEGVVEIGGVPVHTARFASLRGRVGYVPQEGFLFDTSVAENVRYGRPGVNDDAIRLAFADLGLTEWVESLPEGIATPVGEGGSHLSAGERQLVALTRAWMSQPDLLVLDEATSAVDPALEVSLRRAIDRLIIGRTSITIAHRLSTAEASDEVLVFDRGRLVERGHHRDLVDAGGVYASLHRDWMAGTRT